MPVAETKNKLTCHTKNWILTFKMQLTHLDNSMPISTIAVTVDKKR